MTNNSELSIIILSFNTRSLLKDCLESVEKYKNEADLEVIVADNGSGDGSPEMVKDEFPGVKIIENGENLGYARGNNRARNVAKGEYILFLNSDTVLQKGAIQKTLAYIKVRKDVGAITCKTVLPDGKPDRDARRRFPTPWISFNRLFLGNGKPYWYGDISPDLVHEVDVIQGAFFLTRKKILDEVDWLDEEYFLDGEDIDLCWKIRKKGYKIIYYPEVSITHVKKASKSKRGTPKFVGAGVDSMEIFYKKRLWNNYPAILNIAVLIGIRLLKGLRYVKSLLK